MKVIKREASDNKYLHRDFHVSMNMLMEYICTNYGEAALTKYLMKFSKDFHKPRNRMLAEGNLEAVEKYFKDIYEKEEWPVEILLKDDVLIIKQKACPGISHIRKQGFKPVKQYEETYSTVYTAMCDETPYEYILERFDSATGACEQRFERDLEK